MCKLFTVLLRIKLAGSTENNVQVSHSHSISFFSIVFAHVCYEHFSVTFLLSGTEIGRVVILKLKFEIMSVNL